jgi:hypothetical protein
LFKKPVFGQKTRFSLGYPRGNVKNRVFTRQKALAFLLSDINQPPNWTPPGKGVWGAVLMAPEEDFSTKSMNYQRIRRILAKSMNYRQIYRKSQKNTTFSKSMRFSPLNLFFAIIVKKIIKKT